LFIFLSSFAELRNMLGSMSTPDQSRNPDTKSPGAAVAGDALIMGFGVLVLAVGLKTLTGTSNAPSSLWLANGFALGLLLTAPRSRWPLLLSISTVAGAASAVVLRAEPSLIVWVALFNTLEVLVAAVSLSGVIRSAADITSRSRVFRFLLSGVLLAPAVMVVTLGLFDHLTGRPFTAVSAQRIFISHALGMSIMAPVALALRSGELRQYITRGTITESALTLLVLIAMSALVFYQSILPLLFLIFPPMMRVAYRGGFAGTAVALLVVVLIGAFATATGHGPVAAVQRNGSLDGWPLFADGYIVLQVFVAALLVSLFPMIMSLAEGQRAHQATEELQNRLRLLMAHASDVIILTDLDGLRLYVSPAVREVIGFEPEQFLRLTWRDYVHEDDQAEVGAKIEEARIARNSRVLSFRVRQASGAAIWVEANVKHFRDRTFELMQSEKDSGVRPNCGPNGDEGFVITLRDITVNRLAEQELARANADLAALVRKDPLTGLANRRCFDEELQTAWAEALAGGWPIAVLMIDVDHFKQFNDCYGHQRGDLCLRDVAVAIVSGLFHPDDVAARYGGEEFAVILPRTTTDNAAQVAERIRRAVHDLRRPHVAAPQGVLTISVGVAAAWPVRHGEPLAVVRAADEALYTSKHEGRNRTTLLDVSWPAATATGTQPVLPAPPAAS
jgi:diguanylate cyclase (GGDEF)-like protein/PAS domain S-box-containing protein